MYMKVMMFSANNGHLSCSLFYFFLNRYRRSQIEITLARI